MFVSVIIPNYNHAPFLKKRIDSVLNQTYQDFEVIILDDCSTDNSKKTIEQYRGHPKISRIVYNQQNSGSPFKQWLKGIALSKGDWIWTAESDDYCLPNLLSELVDNVQKFPGMVISYCQSFEVDGEGTVLGDISWHVADLHAQRWKSDFYADGTDEIKNYLFHRNTIPNASAVLFKKTAYEQADKGFQNMKFCGDWLLWIQMLKQGAIAFKSQPLNFFRQHAATTRVLDSYEKRKKRLEEEYEILDDIKKTIRLTDLTSITNRMKDIEVSYGSCFTKKELAKLLISPVSYTKAISPLNLSAHYIKSKLSQTTLYKLFKQKKVGNLPKNI